MFYIEVYVLKKFIMYYDMYSKYQYICNFFYYSNTHHTSIQIKNHKLKMWTNFMNICVHLQYTAMLNYDYFHI